MPLPFCSFPFLGGGLTPLPDAVVEVTFGVPLTAVVAHGLGLVIKLSPFRFDSRLDRFGRAAGERDAS